MKILTVLFLGGLAIWVHSVFTHEPEEIKPLNLDPYMDEKVLHRENEKERLIQEIKEDHQEITERLDSICEQAKIYNYGSRRNYITED